MNGQWSEFLWLIYFQDVNTIFRIILYFEYTWANGTVKGEGVVTFVVKYVVQRSGPIFFHNMPFGLVWWVTWNLYYKWFRLVEFTWKSRTLDADFLYDYFGMWRENSGILCRIFLDSFCVGRHKLLQWIDDFSFELQSRFSSLSRLHGIYLFHHPLRILNYFKNNK